MDIMPGDEPLMAFGSDDDRCANQFFLPPCGMVLHLNVGGVRYITTYSTLLSKGANFFKSLLTQKMGSTKVAQKKKKQPKMFNHSYIDVG